MADNMQKASDALEFEKAAELRDRIQAMSSIQAHQHIHVKNVVDADIIGLYCVQEVRPASRSSFSGEAVIMEIVLTTQVILLMPMPEKFWRRSWASSMPINYSS